TNDVLRRAHPVRALDLEERRLVSWQEAREFVHATETLRLDELGSSDRAMRIDVDGGRDIEVAGAAALLLRTRVPVASNLSARARVPMTSPLSVRALALAPDLHRLDISVSNESEGTDEDDDRQTMHATHVVVTVDDGAFVSAIDPPAELADRVAECVSEGAWA